MKDKKNGLLRILIMVATIAAVAAVAFVGIGDQHKGSAKNIRLGLDLAGGVSITYETVKESPSATEMKDTIYKIQKRVEGYSTEAAVYQEGTKRINVDIPGVTDANAILEQLGQAGSIQFTDEEGTVIIDGSHIVDAKAETIEGNAGLEYQVALTLNTEGTTKFAEGTQNNLNKTIAIVYDGATIQAPNVESAITDGKAVITGQNTFQDAEELASTIRIGALPLELSELRSNVVGAKLGVDAMNTSLIAGLIGFIIIFLFMIAFYRIPGLAASIALTIYVGLVVITINGFDVTLTLPGIAGIVLSIGMAVDANCIIFTRIREELAAGKSVRSAIDIGFHKALSAIIDGNVTTLIAAAVLWYKGTGTVKGFAQTLAIGVVLSLFTALTITRFILKAFYKMGMDDVKYIGIQKQPKQFSYTKHIKKFAVLSFVLIVAGFIGMGVYQNQGNEVLNYGLDFKGGTSAEVPFAEEITPDLQRKVEEAYVKTIGEAPETSAIQGTNSMLIKTKELNLEQREKIETMLVSDYQVDKDKITTESISAAISSEMQSDAILSVIIATLCMLVYIWIRFKDIRFASSAVIALLHDVLVVLTLYVLSRISVGGTFIACMLTIVGYSVNGTIIIFDRIRENLKTMKKGDDLEKMVNTSIAQTLSRTINTNITTFIMVAVLFIFGVESVKIFALPLMVGIVCGTYTSVCLTGPIWYLFKTKLAKKN